MADDAEFLKGRDGQDPNLRRPRYSSNPLVNLFFGSANFVLRTGYKRTIGIRDLWTLKGDSKTQVVDERVQKMWREEKAKPNPSLLSVLIRLAPGLFLGAIILFFLNMLMQLVPVIVLPYFISWLTYDPSNFEPFQQNVTIDTNGTVVTVPVWIDPSQLLDGAEVAMSPKPTAVEDYWGWVFASIIVASGILSAFFEAHAFRFAQEATVRVRAAIMLLVYQKTLIASSEASPPTGMILALLTSDTNVIGILLPQLFMYLNAPLQLIGPSHPRQSVQIVAAP